MRHLDLHGFILRLMNGLLIVYIIIPIVLLIVGSFGKKWFGTLFPEGFTLEWYRQIFSERMYLRAMRMSIFIGVLTVIVNVVLTVPAVYAIYGLGKKWLRSLFNSLVMLPIAIPPLVLAMGLIQSYNWPWFSLVGTWQILLAAHVIYSIPFMVRPVMANLELIDWKSLDEAAESLGASRFYTILRVLVPNLQPGILAGAIMTLAMSLGEFQLAVILTGSTTQTYPVTLYQAFYVGTGFACAATVLLVAVAVFALWSLTALTRFLKTGISTGPVGGI